MITLPQQAQEIINTLHKNGFQAYAVGGSVRDGIMGKPTKGWDFTTDARPEDILKLFPDSYYDNQFGTVGIKIYASSVPPSPPAGGFGGQASDNEPIIEDVYEVTTFRSEKGYSDRRHPDSITWGKTIEGHLQAHAKKPALP